MPKQSEGTYYLSAFEITREQHRHLKLAAALNDCPIKEWVTKKLFDPADMKAITRRAQIIAELQADIEADIEAAETPEPPEESTDCEPDSEADIPPPPPPPKRSKADRKSAYRRSSEPPMTAGKGSITPVTDSLSEEERERILAALDAESGGSYTTEDGGWERDEDPAPRQPKRRFEDLEDDDFIDDDDAEDGDPEELDFND